MRKPDVIIRDCELYCGDSREILAELEFESIVSDPPYGINHPCNYRDRGRGGIAKCNNYPNVIGDSVPFDPAHLLAKGVPMILWGANYYADKLPSKSGWLVWDKERPDTLDQATCELAWSNCVKGVRRFRYLWNGCMRAGERKQHYHPTQKPVALMQWCLNLRWTQGLHSVCDPYMGGGSTMVACAKLGRRGIGIEIDRHYFDISCKRIQDAYDSLDTSKADIAGGGVLAGEDN